MITIKDVARLAGVAPVTASRALNNPNLVNVETVQRVKDAVTRLDYRPNMAARGLRTGKAHLIAISCPQLGPLDPVLFDFASGVSQACDPMGYSMLIDRKLGTSDLDRLIRTVAGFIITDVRPNDSRIEHLKCRIPIAVFGPTNAKVPQLDLDELNSMTLAINHLRDLGYERIAYITHGGDQQYVETRRSLYVELMKSHGATPTVSLGSNDFLGGYAAMGAVAMNVEAVICANDIMAFGVARYQSDHPHGQMPVIALNAGFLTDLCSPRLTAVVQPFFQAGELLGAMLLDFIQSGRATKALLEPSLVVKESTWPKGGQRPNFQLSDMLSR